MRVAIFMKPGCEVSVEQDQRLRDAVRAFASDPCGVFVAPHGVERIEVYNDEIKVTPGTAITFNEYRKILGLPPYPKKWKIGEECVIVLPDGRKVRAVVVRSRTSEIGKKQVLDCQLETPVGNIDEVTRLASDIVAASEHPWMIGDHLMKRSAHGVAFYSGTVKEISNGTLLIAFGNDTQILDADNPCLVRVDRRGYHRGAAVLNGFRVGGVLLFGVERLCGRVTAVHQNAHKNPLIVLDGEIAERESFRPINIP